MSIDVKVGDRVIYCDCYGNNLNATILKVNPASGPQPVNVTLTFETPNSKIKKVVASVPHISSVDYKIAGRHFFYYDVPEEVSLAKHSIKTDYT